MSLNNNSASKRNEQPDQSFEPGVSVVICCYNSAARLPETLKHLARQALPVGIPWEVIVVDNGSTDDTAAAARRSWSGNPTPATLRIVSEAMPGLSYARDRGIEESQYELLVFVDDDNWLEPDYLRIAHRVMAENPKVAVLGGAIAPAFETEPPKWFEQMQSWYAVGPQGKESGDVTAYKPHVAGAGMIVRKSALEDLRRRNFQFLLRGRTREAVTSGEDTELCLALAVIDYRIWYDDRLRLVHFIPQSRLTKTYLRRMIAESRETDVVVALYENARTAGSHPLRHLLFGIFRRGWWVAKGMVKACFGSMNWFVVEIELRQLWYALLAVPPAVRLYKSAPVSALQNSKLEFRQPGGSP